MTTLSQIRVITKLPNSEQSNKGKVKTHKYINRQNQSTTGKQRYSRIAQCTLSQMSMFYNMYVQMFVIICPITLRAINKHD